MDFTIKYKKTTPLKHFLFELYNYDTIILYSETKYHNSTPILTYLDHGERN